MRKYLVRWKRFNFADVREEAKEKLFDDILFKDFYVRVVDDELGEKYAIPYTSIYEIQFIDVDGEA